MPAAVQTHHAPIRRDPHRQQAHRRGSRSQTGDVQLSVFATGAPTAASFSVTGEGAYTYAITLPTDETPYTIKEVGNASMTVTNFVSDPSGTGALTSGLQTINVGATLNVGTSALQTAGVYTNAVPFNVTIIYN